MNIENLNEHQFTTLWQKGNQDSPRARFAKAELGRKIDDQARFDNRALSTSSRVAEEVLKDLERGIISGSFRYTITLDDKPVMTPEEHHIKSRGDMNA